MLVGDWDITTNSDTKWARSYAVAQLIRHPNYRATDNANDFALVRTVNYVKFKYDQEFESFKITKMYSLLAMPLVPLASRTLSTNHQWLDTI